jgi:hypothetical protein
VEAEIRLDKLIMALILIAIAVVPLVYLPYRGDILDIYKIEENFYSVNAYDNVYEPKLNTLLIIEVFLLLLLYFRIKLSGNIFQWYSIYLPLFPFYFFIVISTLLSPYKTIALYGWPQRWEGLMAFFAYLILFLFTANFLNNRLRLKTALKYLLISSFLISLYGLIQFFGFDFIPRGPVRVNWGRPFSTLGNSNFAGSYLTMLLPLALTLYIYANKKRDIYLLGLSNTVLYAFLVVTATRSAWLATGIIIPLLIVLSYHQIKTDPRRIFLLFLVFLLVTVGLNIYQKGGIYSRFMTIFSDLSVMLEGNEYELNQVGSSRMFIYQKSLPLLLKRPLLGSGPDTFARVFPQELFIEYSGKNKLVDKAHCEYLQLAITVGLPALFCYLWFLVSLIKKNLSNLHYRNKYQLALFMAFLGYTIQAAFNISVVAVAPIFWAIMGMNLAVNETGGRG